ncbi:hypothetical protein CYMTET_19986 [Cymbomonas tetramitiformis]|uniref:Uncharacterized protein n=1 Tax=Cymbomonas tetramitiformis TaxID=36881 RepID=A0AAE0G5L0_9CHLO|nr:hypothetical protein CYMTET_19986 [Cymbomonas tetramitiformis]
MSSLAVLVDMVPWLRILGELANDMSTEYPVPEENVAQCNYLVGEVSAFVAQWEELTGRPYSVSPETILAAEAAAIAVTPPSDTLSEENCPSPAAEVSAHAGEPSSTLSKEECPTPAAEFSAPAGEPSSTVVKRHVDAANRKKASLARKSH